MATTKQAAPALMSPDEFKAGIEVRESSVSEWLKVVNGPANNEVPRVRTDKVVQLKAQPLDSWSLS